MVNSDLKKKVKPLSYFIGILRHFWSSTLSVFFILVMSGVYNIFIPKSISRIISIISTGSYDIWPVVSELILITFLYYLAYKLFMYSYFIRDEIRIYGQIVSDGLERVLLKNQRYFENNAPGLLLSKITDLHAGVRELRGALQSWLLPSAFVAVIISIHLFTVLPILSLIILLPVITTCISVSFLRGRLSNREKEWFYLDSQIRDKLNDVLSNSLCVRLFNGLQCQITNQKNSFNKLRKANAKMNWIHFLISVIYDVTILSMLLMQFYFLIQQLKLGRISIEGFSSIMIQTSMLQTNLWQILVGIPQLFVSYSKIKEAMLVIWDGEEEKGGKELIVTKGNIKYDQVSFGYKKTKLFNGFSVSIKSGEMVGLVGKSGAGKTSFVNLLLRLYTQDKGSISIDGQDLQETCTRSIRKHIGIIPQQPLLFNDSIYNNIRYGKFSASEKEIIDAAKMADLHDFILTLPDGYQSSTSNLSGGQKQRVSIARAILKDPPILILDEATSQLDSVTEKYVQDAIEKMRNGRTIIVIAHRLSTLTSCDRIFVFNEGEIVETGTHEELLSLNNEYATLYKTQYAMKEGPVE